MTLTADWHERLYERETKAAQRELAVYKSLVHRLIEVYQRPDYDEVDRDIAVQRLVNELGERLSHE